MSFVIAIGGARGAGKGALARMISGTLRTDVLSLGRVRGLLRASESRDLILDRSVNRQPTIADSIEILLAQSQAMKPAVDRVIDECRQRHASLVIEGTHCLPGMYPSVDVHAILEVPKATLAIRYGKDKIRIGNTPLPATYEPLVTRNVHIQTWLVDAAQRQDHVSVLDATYLPAAFFALVQKIPTSLIPQSTVADA